MQATLGLNDISIGKVWIAQSGMLNGARKIFCKATFGNTPQIFTSAEKNSTAIFCTTNKTKPVDLQLLTNDFQLWSEHNENF